MKKNLLHLIIFLAVALGNAGCKKEEVAVTNKTPVDNKILQTTIAGVNGPTSGKVNQVLNFTVMWHDTAQYANFSHLEELAKNNTTTIKIFATGDSTITSVAAKRVNATPYKFKASTAGTYYLKFYKADNSEKTAIIDTVTVK